MCTLLEMLNGAVVECALISIAECPRKHLLKGFWLTAAFAYRLYARIQIKPDHLVVI